MELVGTSEKVMAEPPKGYFVKEESSFSARMNASTFVKDIDFCRIGGGSIWGTATAN